MKRRSNCGSWVPEHRRDQLRQTMVCIEPYGHEGKHVASDGWWWTDEDRTPRAPRRESVR